MRERAPGPSAFEVLRSLPSAVADPPRYFAGLVRRYGDLVRLPGPVPAFLVGHPDLARQVLEADERDVVRGRGTQRAARSVGRGLLTSESELHAAQRRRMEPLFGPEAVTRYAETVVGCAVTLRDGWSGGVVDVFDAMRDLTAEVVLRCLVPEIGEDECERVVRALAAVAASFWRRYVPLAGTMDRSSDTRATLARSIRAWLDRPTDGLLGALREARDPASGEPMSEAMVEAEILSLLFGGRAGPGTGLAWSFHALAHHPEVEARLHTEVDEVLDGRPASASDLPRLRYTQMVFAESLRVFPPAWLLKRRTVRRQRLLGHGVPAGAEVFVCPYAIHHDARFHPDPERFHPDRFAPGIEPSRHPYAYLPFGGGAKGCLGRHFAWMEGPLVIAAIAQRWRLRASGPWEPRWSSFVTLKPRGGLPMRLEPRGTALGHS